MERNQSAATGRVVLLTRQPEVARLAHEARVKGQPWTAVDTPYEAAADLLAEPAAAVVIDLRLLGPDHARLIRIARDGGARMLGIGALPAAMDSDTLSGVRLISKRELRDELHRIVRGREHVPADEPAHGPLSQEELNELVSAGRYERDSREEPTPADPNPGTPAPGKPTRERSRTTDIPAEVPRSAPQRELDEEFVSELPPSPRPAVRNPSDKPDPSPSEGLLSDEELAALLEREL